MNEITKLYENAGIEKKPQFYCDYDYGATCPNDNATCDNCGYYEESEAKYPDFTADKQLELIKWLSQYYITIDCTDGEYKVYTILNDDVIFYAQLEDAIACCVNKIWQDLSKEEKQQVKGILE